MDGSTSRSMSIATPSESNLTSTLLDQDQRVLLLTAANSGSGTSTAALAVASQLAAMSGPRLCATSSPAADSEYTVPSAPTATSRAASPGTSAIEICQLKPIGANTCCRPAPSCSCR